MKPTLKYEIIIEPEDRQYCGKCTYRDERVEKIYNGYFSEFSNCLLFKERLGSYKGNAERCGDCKLMCENFYKMPELDPS